MSPLGLLLRKIQVAVTEGLLRINKLKCSVPAFFCTHFIIAYNSYFCCQMIQIFDTFK
jgi:hypothetical protein